MEKQYATAVSEVWNGTEWTRVSYQIDATPVDTSEHDAAFEAGLSPADLADYRATVARCAASFG